MKNMKFNKVLLSLILVLVFTLPMLAGCSLSGNNDGSKLQKNDLETTIVDCRYDNSSGYSGYYYYIINYKNNTGNSITIYKSDFIVKGYDKRDGHQYATFQVTTLNNYTPASSKLYQSCGDSFTIEANSSKTIAIETYVYRDCSEGVTLSLYHNSSKVASFDENDTVISNIR